MAKSKAPELTFQEHIAAFLLREHGYPVQKQLEWKWQIPWSPGGHHSEFKRPLIHTSTLKFHEHKVNLP